MLRVRVTVSLVVDVPEDRFQTGPPEAWTTYLRKRVRDAVVLYDDYVVDEVQVAGQLIQGGRP